MKAWMLAPVVIAVALVTAPVASSARNKPAALRGIGADTCRNFVRDYGKNPDVMGPEYFTWAQGFMTGANVIVAGAGVAKFRDLGGNIKAQQSYLRAYCKAHPLETFTQAVLALYDTLPILPYKPK